MTRLSIEEYKRALNPNRKRNSPERDLHIEVVKFFAKSLPPQSYWFPIPNGSHRNPKVAKEMKEAGEVRAGVPDLCIVYRGRPIFIELKAKGKKPTATQNAAHEALILSGAIVFVARSVVEIKGQLECFLPLEGQ